MLARRVRVAAGIGAGAPWTSGRATVRAHETVSCSPGERVGLDPAGVLAPAATAATSTCRGDTCPSVPGRCQTRRTHAGAARLLRPPHRFDEAVGAWLGRGGGAQ